MSSPMVFDPADGKRPSEPEPEHLTNREQDIIILMADGHSTKEIAARLGISFRTAACHRTHILAKFGGGNTVTVVRYAIRHGLIQP